MRAARLPPAPRSTGSVRWVEESEAVDLAAATDRHARLADAFGTRVALIHGRMKPAEKDAAMAAFAGNGADILVATTVVEVGVDVSTATIMIVEHAERFGARTASPAAGTGRARRKAGHLSAALCRAARRDRAFPHRHSPRDRRRLSHRRGGSAPERRRRAAGHAPERSAGLPPRRPRRPRGAAGGRPRRRAPRPRARPRVGGRARPGAAHAALPLRARPGGALPALGLIRIPRTKVRCTGRGSRARIAPCGARTNGAWQAG